MSQDARMTPHPRSIPEVIEQLVQEFDGRLPGRAVTDVVRRVSSNGAVSLRVLAEMARDELHAMADPGNPEFPHHR